MAQACFAKAQAQCEQGAPDVKAAFICLFVCLMCFTASSFRRWLLARLGFSLAPIRVVPNFCLSQELRLLYTSQEAQGFLRCLPQFFQTPRLSLSDESLTLTKGVVERKWPSPNVGLEPTISHSAANRTTDCATEPTIT
jgi:hypothetical protein